MGMNAWCACRVGCRFGKRQSCLLISCKSLGQRYTETAGAAYEQLQEQEVERLEQGLPTLVEEKIAEKLQISTDEWFRSCTGSGQK
jgi:hypothetical protein